MYLGIDLGTSALKLLLMDKEGKVLKTVSKDYPVHYPKTNWAEQNPNDWWKATIDGITEINKNNEHSIKGLSFSGQMHGLVILDKDDNVIRPAILWCDQRTESQCNFLNKITDDYDVKKLTGNQALTGFTAPKILWIKENEPENFKKIDKIMLPKDYLAYKLTGVHATDTSDASGMLLLDVEKRTWSEIMMNKVGIRQEQLAKIYESYECIGPLKDEAAKLLGLSKGTDVIIGGGDQAVGAIGVGAIEEGIVSVALGTSGVIFSSTKNYYRDEECRLHSFCHANGNYHQMGVILSAAASYKWWVEGINESNDYDYYNTKASEAEAGSNDLYFLPYLMGERTPHNDSNARGTFVGLNINHNKGDMTRAILEGVGYALNDSLELLKSMGIKVEKVRISGGGAKSNLWRHILANIFDKDIVTVNSEEGPAFGAAILAAVGCGEYPDVNTACLNMIQETTTTSPEKDLIDVYTKGYNQFKSYYPALKDVF